MTELRAHPDFEKSHIVLCGERNTGHEVHYLGEVLNSFSNKSVISQHGGDDEGWWTDASNKQRQLNVADEALGYRQVRFAKDWVTAHNYAKETPESRRTKILNQLESELKRWGEHEKPTKDPSAITRTFISGRVDENGIMLGAPDDLAFSFCFSIWLCGLIARKFAPGVDYVKIFGIDPMPPSGSNKRKRNRLN